MTFNKIYNIILDCGLIFLIIFTPLAFGAVHIWAYTIAEIIIFFLLILFSIKYIFFSKFVFEKQLKPIYALLGLFSLLVLFQLIPLSSKILNILSPKISQIYDLYKIEFPEVYKNSSATWSTLSIYPYITKVSFIKFIAYAGIFIIVIHEIKEKKRLQKLIVVLLITGFLESLYGLFSYFNKSDLILWIKLPHIRSRATGTFVNSNHFAAYLSMIACLGIGYILTFFPEKTDNKYGWKGRFIDFMNTSKASKQGITIIMVVTIMLGIVFSLSRMGVFSFIASILFISFLLSLNKQKKKSNIVRAIFYIGIIVSIWYGVTPLEERIYMSLDNLEKSRTVLWQGTLKLVRDFPLLGSGLGTYENVFRHYQPSSLGVIVFNHAHNDYLELLAEVGWLGFILIISLFLYFFILVYTKWLKRRYHFAKGIALGALGAFFYIMLHSLTDFSLHIPANMITFCIILGIAYRSVVMPGYKM